MNDSKAVAFDLDGTLITKNSSFSFCRYLFKKKVLTLGDFLFCTRSYCQHLVQGKSLVWLHEKVFFRIFQGKKWTYFDQYLDPFLDEFLTPTLYHPAIDRLKSNSESIVWIFSSSPTFLVKKIGERLGIKNIFATEYVVDENQNLTRIQRIVDGRQKAKFLHSIQALEKTVYTDSHLDLPFLQAASQRVVVRPNRRLKKIALENRWEIL